MASGSNVEEYELDVEALVVILRDRNIGRNPLHGEIIGLRLTEGWWGQLERFQMVRLILQDEDNEPLQRPRHEIIPRAVNPHTMFVLSGPLAELQLAFQDLDLPEGPLRFGPLANGHYVEGDPYSRSYRPVTMAETAQMTRDELEDTLNTQSEIEIQMINLLELYEVETRALRRQLAERSSIGQGGISPGASHSRPPVSSFSGLPSLPAIPGIHTRAPSPPRATSTPGNIPRSLGDDNMPSSSFAGPSQPRVSFHPGNPFAEAEGHRPRSQSRERRRDIPSAPVISAPVPSAPPMIQYIPVPPPPPVGAVIPIQHIRSVTGEPPRNPREIPIWLGRNAPAIDGVFPTTTPDLRCRIINALLGGNLGLSLTPGDCITWDSAVATLFIRTYGQYPLHQLGNVLKGIADQEGVATAYTLGMMLSGQNYQLVSGIIRGYLPGQAVVTAMQQRLDQEIDDQTRAETFIQHLNAVYEILGLNARGQSIRASVTPQPRPSRGRGRGQSAPEPSQGPVNSGRGRQCPAPGQNDRGSNIQNQGQENSSQGGYNLRSRTYQPQRYGGGRGRRWNENTNNSETRPTEQSPQTPRPIQAGSGVRGNQSQTYKPAAGRGGRGNQNRNQRSSGAGDSRAVNTVTQSATSSTDESSSTTTAAPSGGQGN
ncbi:gag protein [Western chimpanzee simian foamy virus]|uniref:Gag polyprotein n=1 Tax=Simian foamy virus (isolate chimpanzee) TaxID=298339 RepID=GAG_SFVCP|nr:gag protein [Western chimpanzee simian foamy virus]Q87039.1 RecName: Full=Gag polyprotein; AltName: Full=Pr71Gag; Contains: RecName: Full=Gag protein; AltName: Full=p68Gag; Contains: RecName: Full=p3; AltName: Full=p3Gag [Pan troglodytes foamy virus]AAA19977.1 gag [Western chimpanzee simian foamy virus]ABI95895.1 SFV-gag protein [synthetic construct]